MSRFLFNLVLAAGLGCSVSALAQTHDTATAMAEPATHATPMGGHVAMPQNGVSHHMVYSADTLHTGNLADQAMRAVPSQEFLNSVGR